MVDCFITALGKVVNDVSRHMCLKQFTYLLMEQNNIEVVGDKVQSIIYQLFQLQVDIVTCKDLPTSV
jgi:hypothetical protein